LTTHVRYQGLQGTVPISLDARNLPAILALKEIAPWRNAGGLIVSAPLGVPAALEGITGSRDNFPARRLSQDAFLAGNDVLLLFNFAFDDNAEAQFANIKNAIGFFQEKYQTDPNFQRAVDRSVRRVLKAKIKIYGENLLGTPAQQAVENLNRLGTIPIDLDRIAQASVTLVTPDTQEGLTRLTDPPQPGENVLIFTDDRLVRDCLTCPEFRLIPTTALEEIVLRLFGPNATGQISAEQLSSFSFEALKELLSGNRTETGEAIELATREADWIIFAMLDIAPETYPSSDAVRILLRNRFDALRNKKLVLFAFNAPYFLDETEISQLTAYYGFYSKTQDYLETAARLLFQQFKPSGASPVGIPAIGPLNLSPDPNQIIELEPVHKIAKDGTTLPLEEVPQVASLDLEVGEAILFKTSVIMDRNGHPVPDGTLVDFWRFYPLEGLSLEPFQSRTNRGIAETVIVKERDTPLQVRASSNLAVQSETFNIGPGIVDTPTPTPTWTATPTGTPTPTATPSVTATPVIVTATPTMDIVPTTTPVPLEPLPPAKPVNLLDLIYSLFGAILIGGIAFTLGGERFPLEERVRSALVAVAVGLVGYIFFTIATMAFPHSGYMEHILNQSANSHWVAPLVTLLFAIMGVLVWHLKPGRVFWKEIK
jgi:beta-N-acetylhexosaminidase